MQISIWKVLKKMKEKRLKEKWTQEVLKKKISKNNQKRLKEEWIWEVPKKISKSNKNLHNYHQIKRIKIIKTIQKKVLLTKMMHLLFKVIKVHLKKLILPLNIQKNFPKMKQKILPRKVQFNTMKMKNHFRLKVRMKIQ